MRLLDQSLLETKVEPFPVSCWPQKFSTPGQRVYEGRFQVPSATGVNDIPALAFEPTAAFRCKPEAGSETRGFFEVDCSSVMQLHTGRLA
jgi:hypothetical protein